MNYEIVQLSPRALVGVKINTTNENNKAMKDIGETWYKFMSLANEMPIENRANNKSIGLYCNYEGDFTKPYDFYACCEVSKLQGELPEAYSTVTIPTGKYAKFVIQGDVVNAVAEFWAKLWQMPLDRSYTYDFEEYQSDSADMNNQSIIIYISLN